MFDLHGRVAVVTGASAGLGRQFALALARQGADLAILARREWKLNEVAEEIRALGVKCLVCRCDVRLPEDVANAVKAVIAEYGKVDILVNNAGGGKSKPLDDFPEEDWIDTVNTDVFGVMRCTRDFGREMLKAGYGRIINIASILGHGGLPEIPISDYATSKGAVINFTRQMATEWAQKGITVNCICPGYVVTPLNEEFFVDKDGNFTDYYKKQSKSTSVRRLGTIEEIAGPVLAMCSDSFNYMTGTYILADGGQSIPAE